MPTIPSGYISLEKAKAKLGPLLIGKGWIGELTARERWLVDKHNKNPRGILSTCLRLGASRGSLVMVRSWK
jgi:hypothetical protein